MINTDTLKKFKNTHTGLIEPDGNLVVMSYHGHFEYFKKLDEFRDEIEAFEDMLAQEEYAFIESIPEGEHPGWHSFEIFADDVRMEKRQEILRRVYDMGYARIAKYGVGKGKKIEVETTSETMKKVKKTAKFVAEMFDAELQERVV